MSGIGIILHRDFITTQIGTIRVALRGARSKTSAALHQSQRE